MLLLLHPFAAANSGEDRNRWGERAMGRQGDGAIVLEERFVL